MLGTALDMPIRPAQLATALVQRLRPTLANVSKGSTAVTRPQAAGLPGEEIETKLTAPGRARIVYNPSADLCSKCGINSGQSH
jgi:hypothetical protein